MVGINTEGNDVYLNPEDVFPSPCGEKVGINAKQQNKSIWYILRVSVPLRGKGRDQRKKNGFHWIIGPMGKFPSPCGEKVGINFKNLVPVASKPSGFRPLAGKR